MDSYNIEHYARSISAPYRQAFRDLPVRVGTPAPGFRLPSTTGEMVALDELRADGPAALIFGCYTAPPCVSQLPRLERGYRELAPLGVRFALIYTREIHPGAYFPPHRSVQQKTDQARRLQRETGVTFPVLVDTLEGTVHRQYGGLPSMAYLVRRDGRIVYRAEWTHALHLLGAMANLLDGERLREGTLGYVEELNFRPGESDADWRVLLSKYGAGAEEDWRADRTRSPLPGIG